MKRISRRIRCGVAAALAALLSGCASTPAPRPSATTGAEAVESLQPPAAGAEQPADLSAPLERTEVEPEAIPEPRPEPLVLKPDYPERYVVGEGDTLWGLASRFLRDPWRWPELWHDNPQIPNPHLIYPGDILTLIHVDGRPAMQVQRGGEAPLSAEGDLKIPTDRPYPVVKLSPQVRAEPIAKAIPTLPVNVIGPFLTRPLIVGEEDLDEAPYVVSSLDEHLVAGAGYRVYVRGMGEPKGIDYIVVRRGQAYLNPEDDDDVLGYEAIYLADARLQRLGDPATFDLVRTQREVLLGDRLLPADDGLLDQHYMPRPPSRYVEGQLIAVHGGVTQIGQYQVVVIDKGAQDGLEAGHVLAIHQASGRVRDPIARERVQLPREQSGTALVFRVFDRLSYALIMNATRPIHLYDAVTTP